MVLNLCSTVRELILFDWKRESLEDRLDLMLAKWLTEKIGSPYIRSCVSAIDVPTTNCSTGADVGQ